MTSFIDPKTLKTWLHDSREIALLDVREHGQYGEAHLFYGIPLPFSRLEVDAPRLVPRRDVRVVVYDEGDTDVAERAARQLAALGYTDVHVLQGGARAWKAAGHVLFAGVNLPSKTFGELAEEAYHTPRVSADQLAEMLARKDKVVVLDGRPVSEFHKMNIPGATCCPNGELAYRVRQLVPDTTTPIVINCAGRTRSIIGAQTLINLGLPNPVYALENGTQGWYLGDHALEHGGTRRYADDSGNTDLRPAAKALAARFDVPTVNAQTVRQWADDAQRSLFLCDVRTPEEFAAGSLPGAQHTPGGQLMQAGDQYFGVRNARLVLFDNDGVRAPTVASWLRQMGHDASVLEGGLASGLSLAPAAVPAVPSLATIDAQTLAARLEKDDIALVDLRGSMQFRAGHIPQARWSIRPRLTGDLQHEHRQLVLVADDAALAAWAAVSELAGRSSAPLVLEGGMAAWRAAGLPVEATPALPADADCIDYLFFVHDRHDGNKEAARRYLAWETGLVAQLDAQERAAFRLPPAAASHA
ncbi:MULTISPECIES: rhodanese-like domain-containing protein [Variovorax]|mgnify:CR=1 FL=1|jgi:rhodanese-related sulfurtransferase|uniref:rhodanese-like domain-containing protein n=1 Tax=Variovorax TaxID=34072 RepID=UPI00086A5036|nr:MULTISPECIES: rhodanese-like domain-containing protein [Variovorax]MBN8752901.1 sulfurtransferase [Variovorax sp.]ODU16838.1 MAG: sulfurtransferase [Variovorax sp. SCN 67-85]ODV25718.1 MAG: sulfurtransferase [Variovorax sp. SCN 67-20]OJZ15291.1 MAG: sulfurtransferase [Variovorax sp. 67-131]UKI08037.1 sulfurtransferase [Variovorax paradoxus]